MNSLNDDLVIFLNALEAVGGEMALLNVDGHLKASHPVFQPLADEVQAHSDFSGHEALFFRRGPQTGQLLSAYLHRTRRGPGAGGVRRLTYDTVNEVVTDGLRLARGMGYKNALAGLWWGGGKGVIGLDGREVERETLYSEFGDFITALNGCYVTAEDVGTRPADMAVIYSRSRFTTCIPASMGGSGNPSPATARGVFMAIQAVARHLKIDLSALRVALQGLGEVGSRLANLLSEAGVTLVYYDPEAARMEDVAELGQQHRASSREQILSEPVDILAPCALGAVLNPQTIPRLNCRAVCGAANNQLAVAERDSEQLHQRGILYVPDFVANRMGIVNCADEQYGRLDPDPSIERHLGWEWERAVGPTVVRLLQGAAARECSPLKEARREAEERMEEFHPLWPGRAHSIATQVWEKIRSQGV